MTRTLLIIALLSLLLVAAAPVKYTFLLDGLTIEATDKAKYTQCVYWEPGEFTPYQHYIGAFGDFVQAEGEAAVLAFCLENVPQ